ncbi:MAG: acetyl-CoA carboxylase biotin carboxylase subunit [Alphaproteobacteria bacterium]|nr:MAG: acetyl-CoA carboxylase biotin carboxylase subunit [Alphaproteobacteria bacterium]
MFDKILIANRGEIACRIARTARRMGLRTVAVYSTADVRAAHVAAADEAYPIGPAEPTQSYLNIDAMIAAARKAGAQAVHPGYGFLAENADFAAACAAADLVFIGPPVEAIRAMGSKSAAKALMEKAGVPLVPGYHGADQSPARLAAAADEIGFPVLIKPSAGGGGKGMRIVHRREDFAAALDSAKREAQAAFGDDRVLIEAYLTHPRHVEVQIFADTHGHVIHLFERDCSVQRRYQKVMEEAPAPGLTAQHRTAMGDAAVAAARAVDYVGAGTVEFIVTGERFYFMEMNTRLQVEHPVSEMITGQDLVEWQIRVAAGEPLPCGQDDLTITGHAIEARLYAEDPARDFLPATGRLSHLHLPAEDAHVRVDSGVRAGDEITVYYDPMLAKVIVWDRDRTSALVRLRRVLAETRIAGVATNLSFLAAVAAHPAFAAGAVDTGFIERHKAELIPVPGPVSDEVLAVASLAELLLRRAEAKAQARRSSEPFSPWFDSSGWRLNVDTHSILSLRDNGREIDITVYYLSNGYRLVLPGGEVEARGELCEDGSLLVDLDGRRFTAAVVRERGAMTVMLHGGAHRLEIVDPLESAHGDDVGADRVAAPMPGKVVKLHVESGQTVSRGAPLIVLEAMKMEHTLVAPADGTVGEIYYRPGDLVEEGAELLSFDPTSGSPSAAA